MGIYIQTNTPTKREWLRANGVDVTRQPALLFDSATQRVVFWQRAPWGDNAALAFDRGELSRLLNSGVFEEVYVVPVEKLREVHKVGLDAWS